MYPYLPSHTTPSRLAPCVETVAICTTQVTLFFYHRLHLIAGHLPLGHVLHLLKRNVPFSPMVDMEMDFRSSSSSHDNAANPLISKEDGLVPSMPLVAWASPNTGLRLKWQFGCSLVFYTMILLVTATQTALISQLWRTKPAPEILGEINGLVPECE